MEEELTETHQQHGCAEATSQNALNVIVFCQFEVYENCGGLYLLDISALNTGLILRIWKNHAGSVMATVNLVILSYLISIFCNFHRTSRSNCSCITCSSVAHEIKSPKNLWFKKL